MDLHPAVQTYFEADRRRARAMLAEAFAPDATVVDEGRAYVGRTAIGAWWLETKTRYQTVLEPMAAAQVGASTEVQARVAGDFPGSPTTLTFAFRLEDGRIRSLEIRA